MSGTVDTVWRAQDTNPGAIEAALREELAEVHRENAQYVPARVLNLVCVVDKEWSGEVANRLRQVGRYHPSRTIVCSVEAKRDTLDASATISAPAEVGTGEIGLLRETVVVDVGQRHLLHLDRIVDPLVVTDLPTVVWSPHRHDDAVDALLDIAQVVLIDSVDEPDLAAGIHRAHQLSANAYVVDLAWLRSVPWRERIAATFDPARLRLELPHISAVTIDHHPESASAALLVLGWLASRLGWEVQPLAEADGAMAGTARLGDQEIALRLAPTGLEVRGLAGLTLETASGRHLELGRGDGGLRARYTHRRGSDRAWTNTEREWTILGASRGESGILGEGIRQALLRDPTYGPALQAAEGMLP